MATRTYKIGLYLALSAAYRYMTRNQISLQSSLTSQQLECFNAVLAAITECLPLILPPAPVD